MNQYGARRMRWAAAALLGGLLMAASTASAIPVAVDLDAATNGVVMPETGEAIEMWGFGLATGGAPATSSPGPVIRLTEGDTLTINLTNHLPEKVSVVIPGQTPDSRTPEFFTDAQGRQRVDSFTHSAAPGGGTASYTWSNLRAGTYLYQSGSHIAVQVQMGLYGAIIVDSATAGTAYGSAASAYDVDLVLLYSEIDPALHSAVSTGNYGPGQAMSSTLRYDPKYFLINGAPYWAGTADLTGVVVGQRVLLRLINVGLENKNPMLLNAPYMTAIAEDGHEYSYPESSYVFLLPPGQTRDVAVTFTSMGRYPLYDRGLNLTNGGEPTPGGALRYVSVAPLLATPGAEPSLKRPVPAAEITPATTDNRKTR